MRHKFHSICPYFAMFPETFVEKHLAASRYDGVVFDPFCGRGTTVFQSLIQGRAAAGCDVNPVAVCVSGAKSDPPASADVRARLDELEELCSAARQATDVPSSLMEFFSLCFASGTLEQVMFLRSELDWERCSTDRFIAALSLGALHGESHRSPNCFSNRMPRTISTKPAYSVRWWKKHGYSPPERNVFDILRQVSAFRFTTPPPQRVASIRKADARCAASAFPSMHGEVTDVITSPPYLDTTNYREDQWLRCWFLGEQPLSRRDNDDGRHTNVEKYWAFLREAWSGVSKLVASEARFVIRIGGRRLGKDEIRSNLLATLSEGLDRKVTLVDPGVTSEVKRSQANSFRGSKPSTSVEHDFCFSIA
ncbi:MAG: site-specific DNA-methyltransferase [Boseongicola sp. SB0677_bin_26]|nr:site-specific DNA-methyltransferase [Boseongicola sp. SB0665_bin_10]MYG27593.1 site-specific DNA-methyltransferase [Boseongicola sp. SB0677_bin_26]